MVSGERSHCRSHNNQLKESDDLDYFCNVTNVIIMTHTTHALAALFLLGTVLQNCETVCYAGDVLFVAHQADKTDLGVCTW